MKRSTFLKSLAGLAVAPLAIQHVKGEPKIESKEDESLKFWTAGNTNEHTVATASCQAYYGEIKNIWIKK